MTAFSMMYCQENSKSDSWERNGYARREIFKTISWCTLAKTKIGCPEDFYLVSTRASEIRYPNLVQQKAIPVSVISQVAKKCTTEKNKKLRVSWQWDLSSVSTGTVSALSLRFVRFFQR